VFLLGVDHARVAIDPGSGDPLHPGVGEANAITKREAERATELHRIDWSCDWDTPGRYRVQNLGPDIALNVRAQITVDDETVVGEALRLESGEAIILDFPRALATYKHEQRERDEDRNWKSAQKDSGLFGGTVTNLPIMSRLSPLHGADHWIRDLLTWQSPAGNPLKKDDQHKLCTLA